MPSNHLILCRPLLLLPSIFLSIRVVSNESVLHIRWPEYWSFSFSISTSDEDSGLISSSMNWFDLLAVQGTPKSPLQPHSSKASILWHLTSWQIDGETMETVTDFILGSSKITADGDWSHEIKICLLLGRKAMIYLDTILKSRDITLLTKVCLVKAMVFLVVIYGFYYVEICSFYACFLESFYHKWVLNFVKGFLCIYWFLSFNLLIWCITVIDLWILKNPYIPGIKPTWSWCMIFLICCWVLFTRILLRSFASMFISDIGL